MQYFVFILASINILYHRYRKKESPSLSASVCPCDLPHSRFEGRESEEFAFRSQGRVKQEAEEKKMPRADPLSVSS